MGDDLLEIPAMTVGRVAGLLDATEERVAAGYELAARPGVPRRRDERAKGW
jgi:hypothetical protein